MTPGRSVADLLAGHLTALLAALLSLGVTAGGVSGGKKLRLAYEKAVKPLPCLLKLEEDVRVFPPGGRAGGGLGGHTGRDVLHRPVHGILNRHLLRHG